MRVEFCGPDGSGKTTLASALYHLYMVRGYRVCYHWFRGSHLIASILARILSRFTVFRGLDNPYYHVSIPGRLRVPWALIEFTSFIPYLIVRLLMSRFCVVVGDRSVVDFIVWISTTLRWSGFIRSIPARFLLGLSKGGFIVYITASPGTLRSRSDVPQGFLYRELALYNVLAPLYSKCIIDTSSVKPGESFRRLISCLKGGGLRV